MIISANVLSSSSVSSDETPSAANNVALSLSPPPRATPNRQRPTAENFRADALFPRIERAVGAILAKGHVVAPVDVLVAMQLLSAAHLEDWRRGRVPYLERVIDCSLARLSRLLRVLRMHAHDLNLVPSHTAYHRHGKGPRQALRFTKTGDPKLEEAYSRHFIRRQGASSSPPSAAAAAGQQES